jgi:GNAT superfamily N-acetyltransferase
MITIDYLKNHPQHIPALAKMWADTIGQRWVPHISIEDAIARFQTHLNSDELPLTLIALKDGIPMGMCSLRSSDGVRDDLTPWLGSLVVDPMHQNKGIGKLLINAIKTEAKNRGYQHLYLFTFDPALPKYYRLSGWTMFATDEFHTHPITIMEATL